MFGLSLCRPSFGNGPLRGSPRLRLQEGVRWRLLGRLYAPGPGLPPVQAHLERFAPGTALSHNRVRPLQRAVRDTERTTDGIGRALSAGVNRRELPSPY